MLLSLRLQMLKEERRILVAVEGKVILNRACLLLFIKWPSVFPTCMNFCHTSDTANHKYILKNERITQSR